jgi:hypothetical protein
MRVVRLCMLLVAMASDGRNAGSENVMYGGDKQGVGTQASLFGCHDVGAMEGSVAVSQEIEYQDTNRQ